MGLRDLVKKGMGGGDPSMRIRIPACTDPVVVTVGLMDLVKKGTGGGDPSTRIPGRVMGGGMSPKNMDLVDMVGGKRGASLRDRVMGDDRVRDMAVMRSGGMLMMMRMMITEGAMVIRNM